MILSIALGIVLGVVILCALPFLLQLAVVAGIVAFAVVRGLIRILCAAVRHLARVTLNAFGAAPETRYVSLAGLIAVAVLAYFGVI